jgi:uncharacterized membrane protein YbhN (UPF0104 family)
MTDRSRTAQPNRLLLGATGIAVGGVCLWLVWLFMDVQLAVSTLFAANSRWLLLALLIFWISVTFRVLRWRRLLHHICDLGVFRVAESLVVGYAMNYLLPARLGEPFRAAYTRRRFGVDGFAVFGSIVTERLLDGLATVLILVMGLALASLGQTAADLSALKSLAVISLVFFGVVSAILVAFRRIPPERIIGPQWFVGPLKRTAEGAARQSAASLSVAVGWTALIWLLESLALWAVLASIDIRLTIAQVLIVLSAGSLSVLALTAPGYIGSLQLVFGLVLAAFALPAAAGVAGATLVQAVFYGSLVLAAAVITATRWSRA